MKESFVTTALFSGHVHFCQDFVVESGKKLCRTYVRRKMVMWRLGDVFSYPSLCVRSREKAGVALISNNFGQRAGSFPADARVDSSHNTERYFKITVVDM